MRRVGEQRLKRDFGFVIRQLRRVMRYLTEAQELNSLYSVGVARLQGAHNLASALAKLEVFGGPAETQARLESEKRLEALAKSEDESGYRLLSAHALIGVWGVLESAIDEWVVDWISERPHDLDVDDADEIKIPAASFVSSSLRDRAEILFTAYRKKQGQSFGVGIDRFERPLALVGLSGEVPSFISDAIFEMHKVRNVYAHCGGRADRQFLECCPWFDLSAGDVVPLDVATYLAYTTVLEFYLILLMNRGYAHVGMRLQPPNSAAYWDRSVTMADATASVTRLVADGLPACMKASQILRTRHASEFTPTASTACLTRASS